MDTSTPTPPEGNINPSGSQEVDVQQAAEAAKAIVDQAPVSTEQGPTVVMSSEPVTPEVSAEAAPSEMSLPAPVAEAPGQVAEAPATTTVIAGVPGPNGEPAPTAEVSAAPAEEQFLGASNAHLQTANQLASPANLAPVPGAEAMPPADAVAPQDAADQTAL